jgi:hypothetical protein
MPGKLRLTSFMAASLAFAGIAFCAPGCGGTSDSSNFPGGGGGSGSLGAGGGGGSLGGGTGGAGGGGAGGCTGLQCAQVACPNGGHTTVSGTVYDPAGKNPLYDVVVYVPNSKPSAFTDHASCDTCASLYTGDPIVAALTGPDGKFTLTDVPVGNNIPLVIQIGKWRRQITIPTVASCADTPLTDKTQTRLPRNRSEGDIPKIAVSTGKADTMECLLERMGVDEKEYGGGASGAGRIHIFTGNGNSASGSTPSESSLWANANALNNYDIVVLSCEGGEEAQTKPASALAALHDYANNGGRVFASHFHYYWFEGTGASPDFTSTATWFPGSNTIPPGQNSSGQTTATINTSFPKGQAFEQWMELTNALVNKQLTIDDSRQNASVDANVNKASTSWITDVTVPKAPNGGATTMYFTFNTPTTSAPDKQCGRVVYSDLHVGAASNDYKSGNNVPSGCATGDLSPQEKALEFMLFDLSSCVTPDNQPPSAPPTPPVIK